MGKGTFVYIDCSNLTKTLHVLGFKTMDWAGLINMLRTKQGATRVYIYGGYSTSSEKMEFKKLEKHGYIVDIKKVMQYPPDESKHMLKCPDCGKANQHKVKHASKRKANCDAELTLDVINDGVRKKYDGIIVFSGDGDFARVYEYVAETLLKPVTVFAPMGFLAGDRTSTRTKALYNKGIIKINALEGILGYKGYGQK